jgi:hypothetical protein
MSHPTRRMKFNPGRSEFLFLATIECHYLKVLANRGRRFISKSIGKKQSFYQCLFHIPTHCQWLGEIIQVGGKRQDQPFFLRQICCSHARNAPNRPCNERTECSERVVWTSWQASAKPLILSAASHPRLAVYFESVPASVSASTCSVQPCHGFSNDTRRSRFRCGWEADR